MTWTLVGQLVVLTWTCAIPLTIVVAIAFDRARSTPRPTSSKNTHH